MRACVQRVTRAKVEVEKQVVGEIALGLVVLLGVGENDSLEDVKYLANKISHLRIFPDDEGKMNRSLIDVHGEVLAISQFTLYADTRKGRRPSFVRAAKPDLGQELYESFVAALRESGISVATGIFQTDMQIELVNDGPVTIMMDSQKDL